MSQLGLVVIRSAGKWRDAGSIPRFSSRFSSKIVIYGQSVILPCTINETLKWLTSLAHLNAEIVGDSVAVRYKLTLPPLPAPPYCQHHFCEPGVKLD